MIYYTRQRILDDVLMSYSAILERVVSTFQTALKA